MKNNKEKIIKAIKDIRKDYIKNLNDKYNLGVVDGLNLAITIICEVLHE